MASHTGKILPDPFRLVVPMTTLPDGVSADYALGLIVDSPIIKGAKTDQPLTMVPPDNFDGLKLPDFGDLWYNHIHIIPNRINVGNLTSSQVRVVEIFNGFFASHTINSVTPTDLSGVLFDFTTPVDIPALGSLFEDLRIDTAGALQFDGFFTVSFDIGDYFLFVSGQRVLVMPFQHDWSDKLTERLTWYTTSSGKSLDGIEQLQSWREYPRRILNYSYLLASTQTNAARLQALFRSLIAGWQTRIFAVPIWTDAAKLPTDALAGTDIVTFNPTYFDYDVGSYVMLWSNEETYELAEIDEVHTDHVKVRVPLTNTWVAGRTVVMPARLAYINASLQGQQHTVDINVVPVSFEFLPEQASLNRLVHAAETTYRTYPVLLTKNNYDPTVSFGLDQPVIRNDANTGIFSIEADQPVPNLSSDFGFMFANHAQAAAFYGWLDRRKGRLGVFWLPTMAHDMQPTQDIAALATGILIRSINYGTLYYVDGAPAFNRRDIMIQLRNGTRYFRRITAATFNTDGTELIGIDTSLGVLVNVGDIDRISFLIPSALKADAVDLEWISGNVSQCTVQIADVYDDTI